GLAGQRILDAGGAGLLHAGVGDQRGLDLDRGEAVPGDVHDVVEAAQDPEAAVGVDRRGVPGDVVAAVLAAASVVSPVGVAIALRIAPHGASHARPGPTGDQCAGDARGDLVPSLVDHGHVDAGQDP